MKCQIHQEGVVIKAFTKRNKNDWNEKYPIISDKTGITYKVSIKPYYGKDEKYTDGSIVCLYDNKKYFPTELEERMFDNNNGKISISYSYSTKIETDYDYDMVNMAKLIIHLHEEKIIDKINSTEKINNDFIKFKNWNGQI